MDLKPGDYALMMWKEVWYYGKILETTEIFYQVTWFPFRGLGGESWPKAEVWIKYCNGNPYVKPQFCNQP